MGWNQGYKIFEATVIGAYDLGNLDLPLLKVLMEPYRDSDIDSGGSADLLSKDGKDVVQIVLEVFGKTPPVKPSLPDDYKTWTKKQESANERYYENRDTMFRKITDKFNWC